MRTMSKGRPGRRPGPSSTRPEILAAARTLFAARGYHATTVRDIAAEAGVNAALVHHYFGSKEQVFVAAMNLPLNPADLISRLRDGGPRVRAAGAFSQLIGFALAATILRAEPLASASEDELAALLAPSVQRYLD